MDDHSKFKYVLLHELGHKMMHLAGGTSSAPHDYDLAALGQCAGGASHQLDSVEWQSAAVIEGYANYYASVVFNTVGGVGCGAYSHYAINWDHSGFTDGTVYSCDAAPVGGLGLSSADYMDDECGPHTAGTANEYDYQRFFWDLSDKPPPVGSFAMDPADIALVIGAASNNPSWNATYADVFPASQDNPKERLAAEAAAFGGTWDAQDDLNGVTR